MSTKCQAAVSRWPLRYLSAQVARLAKLEAVNPVAVAGEQGVDLARTAGVEVPVGNQVGHLVAQVAQRRYRRAGRCKNNRGQHDGVDPDH